MQIDNTDYRQMQRHLETVFFSIGTDCPYGLPGPARYRQAPVGALPEELYHAFLAAGYRRNGNTLYTMACPQCRLCVPIRLEPERFRPNRNQRRVWKKNRDLSLSWHPVGVSAEKLEIFDRFFRRRYPGRENNPREYYAGFFLNRVTTSFEVHYRFAGDLVGVGIVDVGREWLNAVYFYFDPQFSRRSPGTWNILALLEHCRQQQIKYLYLGYWIDRVFAMSYKSRFNPHYLLRDGRWQKA